MTTQTIDGFTSVERLDIQDPLNALYVVKP
jgi:hypothetical protein